MKLSAALLGLVVGLLTFMLCGLAVSAVVKADPVVTWAHVKDPTKAGYDSYVPCVRTQGWLLPVVQCMPTESRSELLTVHGTDPDSTVDCRVVADDPVACRVGR